MDAKRKRSLTVRVEVCGDPVVGLWCDEHALPHCLAIVMMLNGHPRISYWCDT